MTESHMAELNEQERVEKLRVVEQERDELVARIKELEAKLPKTVDKVSVSLGEQVFYPFGFYEDRMPAAQSGVVVMADDDCAKWAVQLMLPGRNKAFTTLAYRKVCECYSTREAAEAAKEKP